MKWEYYQVKMDSLHLITMEKLQELGEKGWELTACVSNYGIIYYFKRQKV